MNLFSSENNGEGVNLRPLWEALLEVYKVFADICDRHGLRYCADSGTALGAVRHKGFIPWDDDIDVQMPRPDYDKFVEIVSKELPPGLAWLDRFNCPDFDNAFGKVIVTDREKVEAVAKVTGLRLGQGLFIDIFPLDGYPDLKIGRIWRRIQNNLVQFRAKYNSGWRNCTTRNAKMAYILGALLLPVNYKIRDHRGQLDFFERRARKYPFGSTEFCVSIGCAHYADDRPFPCKFFGTPKKIQFENTEMAVQEDAPAYLKWYFGDYMKLPPVEKRCGTHGNTGIVPWRFGPEADSKIQFVE